MRLGGYDAYAFVRNLACIRGLDRQVNFEPVLHSSSRMQEFGLATVKEKVPHLVSGINPPEVNSG